MGPVKRIQESLLFSLHGIDSFVSAISTRYNDKSCKNHESQPKDNLGSTKGKIGCLRTQGLEKEHSSNVSYDA